MKKMFHILIHELREAVVPTIFFLVVFLFGAITKTFILESYGLTPTGVAVAIVGALIVAKAVLISDKLPFINRFSDRPLVFPVLWKTAIYWVFCLVFRFIEELIPLLERYGGLSTALEHMIEEVSWPLFFGVQLWLVIALVLYNSAVELDKYLGAGSIRKAFVGVPGS